MYPVFKNMDFIYRIPLLDFDPNNEDEIVLNWRKILNLIKGSSESLFLQLHDKKYPELTPVLKQKVRKYLLRGRFRATPFGGWSGVGLGKWGSATDDLIQIQTKTILIQLAKPISDQKTSTLAPAVNYSFGVYHFYRFDEEDEKWIYCLVARNKLLDKLYSHFKSNQKLSYSEFEGWFNQIDSGIRKKLWQRVQETGILHTSPNPPHIEFSRQFNTKSQFSITLNREIKKQLDQFTSESGALFIPQKRAILERFKLLFQQCYDDRFVPLTHIMNDYHLIHESLHVNDSQIQHSNQGFNLFTGNKSIDLKESMEARSIPNKLQDIQYLFHLGKSDQLILDNVVCNRPFAFSGRFTSDEEVFNLCKSLFNNSEQLEKTIYCDIDVYENPTINFLTSHQSIFRYSINPFGVTHPDSIPLNELYLGVRDDCLFIHWKRKKVFIKSVFQHPLNGNQITHPLLRLLWEISNQDTFKFLPYTFDSSISHTYFPRFTWGNIILQEKKWVLTADHLKNKNELRKQCEKLDIPNNILAGRMDQELLLNWKNSSDYEILWQELQKKQSLNIYDAESLLSTPFQSQKGNKMYPQFVYQKHHGSRNLNYPNFINYLDQKSNNSLYLRVPINPNLLIPFLKNFLSVFISDLKSENLNFTWYFLLYSSPVLEVRLRFISTQKLVLSQILERFHQKLQSSLKTITYQIDTYYPEFEKYSRSDLSISENLFQKESEMVLFGDFKIRQPFVCSDQPFIAQIVSEIWSDIFQATGHPKRYLDKLKSKLRELSLADIQQVRKTCEESIEQTTLSQQEIAYLHQLQKHSFFQNPKKQQALLLNHFHMMCNRFFLLNNHDFEQISMYLTHKKLSKKIFLKST